MAHRSVKPRLKFLHESAQIVFTSSPSTAAFLEAQCTTLARENDISFPESRREGICGACGNIMIPGWTMNTQREDSRRVNPKGRDSRKGPTSTLLAYECSLCHSKTRLPIPTPSPRRKEVPKAVNKRKEGNGLGQLALNPHVQDTNATAFASTSAVATPGVESPIAKAATSSNANSISSGNASSKKRAKARKHGGLHAMLAKSKAETPQSAGFGFDLMDFMKTA